MKLFDGTQVGQNQNVATIARDWLRDAVPAVLVTVAATRGSAPREQDTAMLVSSTMTVGTIGGGHLEWHAIERARQILQASNKAIETTEQIGLGPSLGQCCGGSVSLHYSTLQASHLPALQESERPLFHLNLFGAGHVGQALVNALAHVPCTVRWIDERPDIFPVAVPGMTIVSPCEIPEDEVVDCASGDFYLVMTHSHARDLTIVGQILTRGDAGYLGLIGSKTKRVRFERQLHRRALNPATVHCPIGLPDTSGKEPWRIALSVANDLVARASASRAAI